MAQDLGVDIGALVGNGAAVERIEPARYVEGDVGLPTLRDILAELRKPGRDPREAFELPAFRDDIKEPKDLTPGMVLEGVVTNIVAFGAFVDVGVHQDGLAHVSQLADRYVSDPNQVVKVGQRVRVTVLSVDLERNRIALSMKSQPDVGGARAGQGARREGERPRDAARAPQPAARAQRPPAFVPKPGAVAPNGIRFK
jgi:protein Tex